MGNNAKRLLQFNAFQIKLIALITMTIDHIGAYQIFTINQTINNGLRIIGRIAAPLFLFMIVEGMRCTHNKTRYILRLYTAGAAIEISNRVIENLTGSVSFGNTLPMFFYLALFIFCIEYIADNRNHIQKVCIAGCGLIIPFLFYILNVILMENGYAEVWNAISLFFPSPLNVDYSILFIIMGAAWYFINNTAINCAILALLSLICMLVPADIFFAIPSRWFSPVFLSTYELFVNTQWYMCLAIPFMILYNGEKGRSLKYLFYIYYPLHVYVLFFIIYLNQ